MLLPKVKGVLVQTSLPQEPMWRKNVYGSVDEIHACEEHRLVPADEHTLESEKATEEPFFPENLQLSKSDDVLVRTT